MANVPVGLTVLLLSGQSCPSTKTFHLIAKTMKQSAARAACRESYTDLVTVCSEEENAALTKLTNLTNLAWIGLQRSRFSPKWSNGDEVTFSNLTGSCEPKPFCAAMKTDGSWDNSTLCKETRNFMCYKQDETNFALSYHLITNQSLNWYEAQSYCRKIYTDLVSIRDQEQNEAVKIAGMNSSTPFWIGLLHDDWEWADGRKSAYRNWGTCQPRSPSSSSPSLNCTELNNGKWNSVICSKNVPAALCYNTSVYVTGDYMSWESAPNYCKKGKSPPRTFHLIKKKMNPSEAQAACRANYTDLVTVCSEEENAALIKLINRSIPGLRAWIGLQRSQFSSKWSNGDEVTYNLTGSYGTVPCCAAMKTDGFWQCINCTNTTNFMCYKQDQTDYHLITDQPLNWSDAQSYCRKFYTDLISIRGQEQNEAVKKAGMNSSTPFWIGLLHDDWEWADGGRSAYRNWETGYPRSLNTSSNFTELYNGKWYTVPYTNKVEAVLCYRTVSC